MIDISEIHFHDCQIKRVVEDIESHSLVMEVNYPVNWEKNEFAKRLLIFDNCYNYQVFELPFAGYSTILDAEIAGEENGWSKIKLETNMGRRELICKGVRVV
jgi:hypothetical protein